MGVGKLWNVELLGEVRVRGRDADIRHFESRRAAALLAYLSLFPGIRHSREVLMDRIWPEASETAARNRLKQALSSLRRQLEPPGVEPGTVFMADRNSIELRSEAVSCDVLELKGAVKRGDFALAASLLKGELMPGFYDEWVDDVRLELSSYEVEGNFEAFDQEGSPEPIEPTFEIRVPLQVTSFVGRQQESDSIINALENSRLVTVTGLGGMGKTRITQHVGHIWSRGPVWFVPLAGLDDATQVVPAVLKAMGADQSGVDAPFRSMQDIVGQRSGLLIADNAEHLIDSGIGDHLISILEHVPNLRIVVSSRGSLRVNGEFEYRLSPLDVPSETQSLEDISQNASVRLFLERARQTRPDFQVTTHNCEHIVQICRRLDGIPLAIELCAAWAHFGTSKMLEMLDGNASILTSRRKSEEDRHKSLTSVFESTLASISPESQSLLRQVSILRGGWDWDLVTALSRSEPNLDTITELVESAVVRPSYHDELPRYTLLESLRQHIESKLSLVERDELWERLHAHLSRLVSLSSEGKPSPSLGITHQRHWIDFMSREWSNITALGYRLAKAGLAEELVQLISDTEWYWSQFSGNTDLVQLLSQVPEASQMPMGRLLSISHLTSTTAQQEVEAQFETLLSRSSDNPKMRAEVALRWSKFKILRQDMDRVHDLAQLSLEEFRAIGDGIGAGQALHVLANCFIQEGKQEQAFETLAQSEALFEETGNIVHLAAVSYTRARQLYVWKQFEACLHALYVCRDMGRQTTNMRFLSRTGNLFGVVYRNLGREDLARIYLYLAASASAKVHDYRAMHMPLWNLYISLGKANKWEIAVPTMGVAMRLWRERFRPNLDPQDQPILDAFVSEGKSVLGPAEFVRLEAQGESLEIAEVIPWLTRALGDEMDNYQSEVNGFFAPVRA